MEHGTMTTLSFIMENAVIRPLSYYREVNQLDRNSIILNHIKFCIDSGLVKNISIAHTQNLAKPEITPKGHDFFSIYKK
jgi:hypothetical protein